MLVDSDQELMRRFQSGEEEAFRGLLDHYTPHLINFAYRMLSSRDESEDLAQEVFLRVYKGKDRYDPSRPFRPWIFSIASRLISNRLRDRKRHPKVSLDWKPEEGSREIPTIDLPDKSSLRPEETLENRQLAQVVRDALAALPENQRAAVLLARFEEMSYEEIAQTMESTVVAVKSLLFRARQTLKAALTPYVKGER